MKTLTFLALWHILPRINAPSLPMPTFTVPSLEWMPNAEIQPVYRVYDASKPIKRAVQLNLEGIKDVNATFVDVVVYIKKDNTFGLSISILYLTIKN
jgi:hypothetical protein